MNRINSIIDVSGYLLMLSGALHILAYLLGGLSYGVMGLLPIGILFLLLGYMLQRTEWRWLGYLAYLGVGIGMSFAIREFFISTTTPNWWYGIILLVDLAAVVALFVFLWKAPKARTVSA